MPPVANPESASPPAVWCCFALAMEAAPFRRWRARASHLAILLTGVGRQNAEATLAGQLARTPPPRWLFTCGFAGGLNPALAVGDVLFQTEDPRLAAALQEAGARPGRFYGAPHIVTTVAEKAALRQRTGADAVEMESEVIRALCRARGIACATVRAISDTAAEDLPLDFNRLCGPDGRPDLPALAAAVARSPATVPALWRLQRHCRLAARRLAAVLTRALTPAAFPPD